MQMALMLTIITLILTGCDHRKCIKSYMRSYPMWETINTPSQMRFGEEKVCLKYEGDK